jgi:AcrR family transcriptional regulator
MTAETNALPIPRQTLDLWGEDTADSVRRLLDAGCHAFAVTGFHGTTTRDITNAAGMSPAALYVHFKSKEDLLYRISAAAHAMTLREMEAAFEASDLPFIRLRNLVHTLVLAHAHRNVVNRIANYEMDALAPARRVELGEVRARMAALIRLALHGGIDSGDFVVHDVAATTIAIVSLGIDISRWFHEGGRLSADELGDYYGDLVLKMVAARPFG